MSKISITDLLKTAEIKTQLQNHQQRVVDKLKNQSGLVVAHGMGSGKGLASLAAMDNLGMNANVVTPAALKANYKKEYDKHTINAPKIYQEGLENIARKGGIPNPEAKKNPLLIVDEAHNLRDPSTKANAAIKKINNQSEKSLFLTGTPMYNHPSDISTLVNMAAREKLLPENKADFESKYIYNKEIKPGFIDRNFRGMKSGVVPVLNKFEKDNLQQILNKWVDFHPSSKENFPSVTEEDVKVPMSQSQLALYDSILGTAPAWIAAKIKSGLPPNKAESKDLNAFATGIRQISNTTAPFIQGDKLPESPKIQRAFEELKKHLDSNPQGKAVIYSNWVDAGLNPYKSLLDEAKIPYGEFTGRVDQNTRNQMVQDYNDNKLKALLLSSAGGTGLDLKGSSLMQLLDPHFNASKIDQAQGRAIRFGSHAHLPEEQRKVHVQRFLATRPELGIAQRLGLSKPGGAIDEYLTSLSKHKTDLSKQFEALMKEEELQNEKIAKISDDVEHFLNSKNYNFLLKKLPSKGFQSSLLAKIEDPSLKNFISNNGKHFIALKKRRGEIHSVESSSQAAKSYDVIKHKDNSWTCSCSSYLYNKSPKNEDCKHIDKLKSGVKVAKVIAHISGPCGAGKTTLLKSLPKQYVGKDLDDIGNEAILRGIKESGPNWSNFNKKLMGHAQQVLNEYLEKNKDKDIVLAGFHHTDDGKQLIFPTENRWRLNTGPLKSLWREYNRSYKEKDEYKVKITELPSKYMTNRDDIKQLNEFGYEPKSSKDILKILNSLKKEKTASAYVTHFQQEKPTTCSASCAKMVLDYYGIYKTEKECEEGIGVHSSGAENTELASYLNQEGLKTINKELTPEEVKQFLDMNCPIIIDGKSFRYPDKFHYTVLSDLDLEKNVAVIFDPNYDKKIRTLTLKELDEIWHSKQMYKPHKPLVRQGIVVIGHEKTAEESTFQKYKPYIAGAGGLLAGAAAYKGLRRFNPSANKGLATLQNAMKDKKLAIQVDKASKLHTPIFGAKTVDRTTKDLGKDYGVLNHSTSTRAIPSGGPAINTDLANALDNKVTFDKIMNQGVGFGPSQVANPTAKNTDYLHGALKDVGGDINRLKAKYPEFIMKPATGSLGQVENLVTSTDHPMFQKALKDEGMARNMLIQEKLPIDKEFRVHTLNGVPFSSMNRRIENSTLRKAWEKLTGSSGGGAFIPTIGKERQALNQFVSDAHKHIQPAFEQGHNLHSAYDVAKLKDGTYRMIESNPTPGTLMNPIINRKLQRMATGRWGKDVATLGALSAGAATSAGIANLE